MWHCTPDPEVYRIHRMNPRIRRLVTSFMIIAGVCVFSLPVLATEGCNAVGWEEPHGMTGCRLYYPAVQWMYEQKIAKGVEIAGKSGNI